MPAGGIEVDIASDVVIHHQRQIRARFFYLRLRPSFQVRIDRECHLVSLVDGRRLSFLLGKSISLLQSSDLELIYALSDLVQFAL